MIRITNEKVAGFEPRWATFNGFSLLFDNPGKSLSPSGALAYVNCDVHSDPALSLYRKLRDSLRHIGRDGLTNTYLFCPLPPSSYHITVWDGVNAGNVMQVDPAHRARWERFLQELPRSLVDSDPFAEMWTSDSLCYRDWHIGFRFERLENWSNISVVARLAPANELSANALRALTDARAELSDAFERRFGVRPHETYVPHVTLGYFADRDLAERTSAFIDSWNGVFRERTEGIMMDVRRIGLYGFRDMATFFKASAGSRPRLESA